MRIVIVAAVLVGILASASQAALPAFNTGRLYSEAGFAAAIKPYSDAIATNASDGEAHYWLGIAYLHGAQLYNFGLAPYAKDHNAKAIASLERAAKLRPAFMGTYMALLAAYSLAGDRVNWTATVDRLMAAGRPASIVPTK